MLRGLYAAATALANGTQNQEVVASNIAHASVPGYRRQMLTFEPFDKALDASGARPAGPTLGSRVSRAAVSFEPGPVQHTGNPLDVALDGDSFFVLQGPKGPLYTRNGAFQLNVRGELQSASGQRVAGVGGPISIPAGTGKIRIAEDGAVFADKTEVGKIKLARFPDPNVLQPVGTTLFAAPPGVTPAAGTGKVHQGYREGSNVQAVNELVSMIAGMRQYEAAQHAMRSLSDALEQTTRPQTA